jgi:hypothetical protein
MVAFALAAVVALYVGPNWTERQQHWLVLHWERERREWLARERTRYIESLAPEQRRRFRQAIEQASGRRE